MPFRLWSKSKTKFGELYCIPFQPLSILVDSTLTGGYRCYPLHLASISPLQWTCSVYWRGYVCRRAPLAWHHSVVLTLWCMRGRDVGPRVWLGRPLWTCSVPPPPTQAQLKSFSDACDWGGSIFQAPLETWLKSTLDVRTCLHATINK